MSTKNRPLIRLSAMLAGALLLAGCATSEVSGGANVSGDPVADVAAAATHLSAYESTDPPALLVSDSLSAPIPSSTRIAFLDVGTPVGTIMWQMLEQAAAAAGVQVERVQMGRDAQSINAAMNSVVESAPDAVINMANDPTFFQAQAEQLAEAGIPLVNSSIMNASEFGYENIFNGQDFAIESGRLLASIAVTRTEGSASEFVFYRVPELPFSAYLLEGAQEQIAALCADCNVRVVEIPVTELGNTAADRVISDLQAHPETEYFMSSVDEVQIGLPQKMAVAGIAVGGVGQTPTEVNYQQVLDGAQDASVAIDISLTMWTLLDQALREVIGQDYSFPDTVTVASTLQGVITPQSVTNADLTGFVAIPDYQEQFVALWGGA